jgi:peptidoglycan hydrolase-like protein with peptidoglycan-binding domain
MTITIGSARIGERGKASGGKAGDQKQKTSPDYKGEVSMQNFYVASKGWYILRAKNPDIAANIALAMTIACNNPNIGYNQARRLDIIKAGTHATQPTSCDCSSLVRQCVRESGIEVGNFTTANEAQVLVATGKFTMLTYKTGTPLYLGDILVTCKKGHTVVVTSGNTRSQNAIATPTVKMGSKGDNARLLQHDLNQCGATLEEDGIFGKLSTAALVRWQHANGLTADGIYGKKSEAKMKEILQ